jgi:hypothetical protein
MHGIGLDMPLQEWFEFKIPRTQIPKNYIARILTQKDDKIPKANAKICWLGPIPSLGQITRGKYAFHLSTGREEVELLVPEKLATWLVEILASVSLGPWKTWTFEEFQQAFNQAGLGDFMQFWQGEIREELRELGLLVV